MNEKEMYDRIQELQEQLIIKKSQEHNKKQKCIFCGKDGCEIISFKMKKAAHIKCHLKDITLLE